MDGDDALAEMENGDLLDRALSATWDAAASGADGDEVGPSIEAIAALRASLARVRAVVEWSPEGYNLVSPELDAALDALTDDDLRLLGTDRRGDRGGAPHTIAP